MRGLITLFTSKTRLAAVLLTLGTLGALAPAADAQVSISIGVQPVCSYGYYDYAPYACAPMGFYGSGYFYNGIFLGMGPWAGWGYGHGWGGHRFVNDGGGRYHGGGGVAAYRGYQRREVQGRNGGVNRERQAGPRGGERPNAGRPEQPHHSAPHNAPHSVPAHGGGGVPHGGGSPHGGDGHEHK